MEIPEPLSHVYRRTLRIETASGSGSSFVLDHGGGSWLVTARHVVEDRLGNEKVFQVREQNGTVHSGLAKLDRISGADVAVFRLWTEEVDFGPPLETCSGEDLRPTQDVNFLGFPDLGDRSVFHLDYASQTTPFIKRAMVSGEADYYGIKVWLLDGVSTFGFSGGPLIVHDRARDCYRVFGVISSYVPANVSVMPPTVCFASAAPGVAPPSPNDSFFQTNSGLAIGFDIQHAIDAIDGHPGCQSAE